jgi:hypothetical protein
MTLRVDEAATGFDEAYWSEDNAAQPVLLIDEATQAITEALHRVRSGSVLEERDVAAAGVALGDLFGGLGQLAALLPTSVVTFAESGPREVGPLEETGCRHSRDGLVRPGDRRGAAAGQCPQPLPPTAPRRFSSAGVSLGVNRPNIGYV